jgi:broad specificity phosphatase PhoE
VFVGPRRRHRQTYDAVVAELRAEGVEWPEPIVVDELDEHHGIQLVFAVIPRVAAEEPSVRTLADKLARGELPLPEEMLTAFKLLTRRWSRGELDDDQVERWSEFRARTSRALTAMTAESPRKSAHVAFTSAGAIASIGGEILGIANERVLDLSWSLHNGSLTEVAFSEHGHGLSVFNATPHLPPELVTSV